MSTSSHTTIFHAPRSRGYVVDLGGSFTTDGIITFDVGGNSSINVTFPTISSGDLFTMVSGTQTIYNKTLVSPTITNGSTLTSSLTVSSVAQSGIGITTAGNGRTTIYSTNLKTSVATAVPLFQFSLSSATLASIKINIVGLDSSNRTAFFEYLVGVNNASGSASIKNTLETLTYVESGFSTTPAITFTTSSSTVLVNVTGTSGMNWNGTFIVNLQTYA